MEKIDSKLHQLFSKLTILRWQAKEMEDGKLGPLSQVQKKVLLDISENVDVIIKTLEALNEDKNTLTLEPEKNLIGKQENPGLKIKIKQLNSTRNKLQIKLPILKKRPLHAIKTKNILLVISGIVVIFLSIYFFINLRSKQKEQVLPPILPEKSPTEKIETSPTTLPISPTLSPTPSLVPIVLSNYKVQILNGNGLFGEAGRVKTMLGNLNFGGISIGDANSYDYVQTEIRLKENTPKAVFDQIEQVLNKEYNIEEKESLTTDAEYDVQIIVGQKTS